MGNFDAPNTGGSLRDVLASIFSFASEDDRNLLYALLSMGAGTPVGTFTKAADDAMASTTTAEAGFGVLNPLNAFWFSVGATSRPMRSLGARLCKTTATGVTADAANYGTVNIFSRDTAGGTQTIACAQPTQPTANNGTGNWAAATLAAVALAAQAAATGAVMNAGGTLTWSITKTGTGVIIPAFIANFYAAIN